MLNVIIMIIIIIMIISSSSSSSSIISIIISVVNVCYRLREASPWTHGAAGRSSSRTRGTTPSAGWPLQNRYITITHYYFTKNDNDNKHDNTSTNNDNNTTDENNIMFPKIPNVFHE